MHNVGVRLGRTAVVTIAEDEEIARLVDRAYDNAAAKQSTTSATGTETFAAEPGDVDAAIEQSLRASDRDLLNLDGKGPVIRLVDAMLFEALSRQASDIHLQPLADRTLVRYRVDGVLFIAREVPHTLTHALISRIKVMAQMDVAERNAPQDGRATVTMGRSRGGDRTARSIDLRISTLPTNYGERAVIRLLDNARGSHLADFSSLGMPQNVRTALLDRVERSHGIILVTGPTGSGKTTTLYTLLRHIATGGDTGHVPQARRSGRNRGDLNVMTIEDPIEYELSTTGIAISQSQINPKKGVTFATGLRHILRQDPDVVMVGEIRDAETTKIAMQASLTGHLVLSTLHTNDAASAVTRLVDLGAEPYLVAASLSAVMAQRLVRRLHFSCRGSGCAGCLQTGYSGRLGVFELLLVDETLRDMVSRGGQLVSIREHAAECGMRTLMDEGKRLVREGQTDESEVRRVLQGMEDADLAESLIETTKESIDAA
ncbi:MAG: type II/IV secretion system protein [Phycisphaeraceae bacterium]|nr:type II/IV secretion system protein [Phycisphaeraceae bacterium]